jgi:uncharacterized membrane protein YfcA
MSSELMFAVFVLSGVAVGFFAGLFGIGGGLIMLPSRALAGLFAMFLVFNGSHLLYAALR